MTKFQTTPMGANNEHSQKWRLRNVRILSAMAALVILGAVILYRLQSTSSAPSENEKFRLDVSLKAQLAEALGLASLDQANRVDLLMMYDDTGCIFYSRVSGLNADYEKWLPKSASTQNAQDAASIRFLNDKTFHEPWWDLRPISKNDKIYSVVSDNARIEIAIRISGNIVHGYIVSVLPTPKIPTALMASLRSKPAFGAGYFPSQDERHYAWWQP